MADVQLSTLGDVIKTAYEAEPDTNAFTDSNNVKLAGIEDGATANSPDATLLNRANHTGTQTASTISDFDTEVSNNASVAANTAKVSADGSVTSHSDVTNAGSGAIITTAERNKLVGIEAGAEVNTVTTVAGRTGAVTLTSSDIADFQSSVSSNSDLLNKAFVQTRKFEGLNLTVLTGLDFTVGVGSGAVVDYTSGRDNPTITLVNVGTPLNFTVPAGFVIPNGVVYVCLNSDLSITYSNTFPKFTGSVRQCIYLGGLLFDAAGNLGSAEDTGVNNPDIFELAAAIGPIATSGIIYSGNPGSLTIKRSEGDLFAYGRQYSGQPNQPHLQSVPSINTSTGGIFIYAFRDAAVVGGYRGIVSTQINPGLYDSGGSGLGTTPTGVVPNNSWGYHVVYVVQNGLTIIQYGTSFYASLDEARSAAKEILTPPGVEYAINKTIIYAKGNATDLTDPAQGFFEDLGRFGLVNTQGGGGGGGAASLDDLGDVVIGTPAASTATSLRILADTNTDGTYTVVDWTPPTGGGGEANTASNLGAGQGLFTTKTGVNLPFKGLVAGSNVTLSSNATDVIISAQTPTNLAYTPGAANGIVTSDTGTDATIPAGSTVNASLMLPGDKTKLNGIESGATSNSSDAALLNRANHTGTQTASTISDFDTEVSNNVTVVANTAKVSADGTVTSHSDVTNAGSGAIITTTERNKLVGIATGATANSTDAFLLNRANHTGTQTASTISDFDSAADARIAASDKVSSDPSGVTGADAVPNIMSLTTAEFGAITPVATTLYIITDAV